MATNPNNPTPAAATSEAPDAPAKTTGTTPETKAKAARTTARKPRARRASNTRATGARTTSARTPSGRKPTTRTASGRKPAARRTPGATAARPSLGRPVTRPVAVAPDPEAVTVEVTAGTTPFAGSVLDAVEAAGTRVADYHEQIAETTPLPWVANVARANAELTRMVTRAYVSGGRTLLRP